MFSKRWVVLSIVVIGGIFLFLNFSWADNADVVINEIGAYEPDNHEWIEIYNRGLATVDLMGWRFLVEGESAHSINLSSSTDSFVLGAGEYGIIAENAGNFKIDYPMCSAKIFDTANFTLNESGSKKIGLRDNNDVEGEYFNYPEAKDFSLERVNALLSALENSNWHQHPSGNTVGAINYWSNFTEPQEPEPTTTPPIVNQLPIAIINGPTSTNAGDVVEFDGSDSSDPDGSIVSYEWSVDGVPVADSSVFSYQFATSGTSTVGLTVVDNQGSSASTSLEVFVDPISTSSSFTTTTTITTGVYINEFLPDPSTSTEHEWVELYNVNTSSVDLSGWTFLDSVTVRNSPTGTIVANGFYVIELNDVLNNTGDTLTLKNPLGEIVGQVVYGNTTLAEPAKGNSLARNIDGAGVFEETTSLTKGRANIIVPPVVVNNTNHSGNGGSQTSANDTAVQLNQGNPQIIINELLPNPAGSDITGEYFELKNLGNSAVDLKDWTVSNSANAKFKIKEGIISTNGFLIFKRSQSNLALKNTGTEIIKLFNPAGGIINQVTYVGPAEENVSYSRQSDGSWKWTSILTPGAENIFKDKNLPPEVVVNFPNEILTGETAVFDASDSVDPEGGVLKFTWATGDEEKSGEIVNFVFERAGKRVVTLKVADDGQNVVEKKLNVNVVRDESLLEAGTTTSTPSKKNTSAVKSTKIQHSLILSLGKIKSSEVGDLARVKGIVSVLPGVLGTQYFYLLDEASGAGAQIYCFKKDFPALAIGDEVVVNGEVSESRGEKRIKIKTKVDIKKIGSNKVLMPETMVISDLSEDNIGSLVQVQGEVTEVKSANVYLDDGSNEVKVYFKSGVGIDSKMFKLGEVWQVAGLAVVDKDGVQILPRAESDLQKIGEATTTIHIADNSQSGTAETYLTATAGGLTSILLSLLAKARGRVAWSAFKKVGALAVKIIRHGPPKV